MCLKGMHMMYTPVTCVPAALQESDWTKGLVKYRNTSGRKMLETTCLDAAELPGLLDFLGCMLQHDMTKRLKPQDLLNHSWLRS